MKRVLSLLAVLGATLAFANLAHASFTGTLYVTRFDTHHVDSVTIVNNLVVGSPVTITTLPGADGIECSPDSQNLLVGGQFSNNLYKISLANGTFSTLNTSPITNGAFHIKFNLAGTSVYASALYSNFLATVNYTTGATVNQPIAGVTRVTGVQQAPNGVLYITDAPEAGNGALYTVNTTTWTATRILPTMPCGHGIIYDPFTGNLFLTGAGQICEVSLSGVLIRTWDVSGLVGTGPEAHLDQGFSDGRGDLFVASNAGPLVYLNIAAGTAAMAGDLGPGADDVTACAITRQPPPPPQPCTSITPGAPFTGTLYVSYFDTHNIDSVRIVNNVMVGAPMVLTTLPGADGIECGPDSITLIVGGQRSNNVFRVNTTTGAFSTLNTTPLTFGAFHVKLDQNADTLYVSPDYVIQTNQLGIVTYPGGITTYQAVAGVPRITGIVQTLNGSLYVTDALEAGNGSVYLVNRSTWTATPIFGPSPCVHGINFDPLTGHLFLTGGGQICEITLTGTLVHSYDVSGLVGTGPEAHLDQGFTDGRGNLFVASNAGPLVHLNIVTGTTDSPGNLGPGADDVTACRLTAQPCSTRVPCQNNARTFGFWKHQCATNGTGQVRDSMSTFLRCVTARDSKVFGTGGCFAPTCEFLLSKFSSNLQAKAAQQYLTLLLNLCSGRICDSLVVRCSGDCGFGATGGLTVGRIVAIEESLLCQRGKSTSFYSQLGCLAECVNSSAETGTTGGTSTLDGISVQGSALNFRTTQVGSNPVSLANGGSVHFRISTGKLSVVRLAVFDAQGRLVAVPVSNRAVAGDADATWDGITLQGQRAASGTYFYRATAGGVTASGRFLIVR